MIELGRLNTLQVSKRVDFGVYLTDGDGASILLPRGEMAGEEFQPGDRAEFFVYLDSEDRPVATARRPAGMVGDIVRLRVSAMTPVGAFLDWGLAKELLVPFREMRNKKMIPGDFELVAIRLDEASGRIVATNRFDRLFRRNDPSTLTPGDRVPLIVWRPVPLGWQVLVDRRFCGMLYRDEVQQQLQPGDRITGYVVRVREDRKIDLRLRPDARDAVAMLKPDLLEQLRAAGGFLPINAGTPAETIRDRFHLSRKLFKQVVGALYKERKITVSDDGIRLADTSRD